VFAAVCVLLAALGHVMMSGSHVPAWVLAAGFAATGAVGWRLAGRERGLVLIVAAVVTVQTLLHAAFSLAQSASGASAGGSTALDRDSTHMGSAHMSSAHVDAPHMGSAHTGSAHTGSMHMDGMDSMSLGHTDLGLMDMSHLVPSAGGGTSSFGMLAAHLLAALLCGLWLAHGERAAFRILRAVAGRLAAPLRLLLALPATPDRPRPRGRRPHPERAPRLLLLVHAITSRGPPLGTAVV
jgi:hypothetical protein